MDPIPAKVIDYINESRSPLSPLTHPDEPLHLDSLGLIRLVSFMEIHCDFWLEDEDLVPKNFVNLRTLAALINKKSRQAREDNPI